METINVYSAIELFDANQFGYDRAYFSWKDTQETFLGVANDLLQSSHDLISLLMAEIGLDYQRTVKSFRREGRTLYPQIVAATKLVNEERQHRKMTSEWPALLDDLAEIVAEHDGGLAKNLSRNMYLLHEPGPVKAERVRAFLNWINTSLRTWIPIEKQLLVGREKFESDPDWVYTYDGTQIPAILAQHS